jgi:hypothetical protein
MRNNNGQFKKGHGYWKGKKRAPFSEAWKRKITANLTSSAGFKLGHEPWNKGRSTPIETRKKISATLAAKMYGEHHPHWIADRSNDSAYAEWRRQVWERDGFKCKITDPNCAGRIEAHHILPWRDFPELRYQTNNGITLCHHHHPRARAAEMELSPFFQRLVADSASM